METSTILVEGATGTVGTEISRQLRAKKPPIKAMANSISYC